MTVRIFARPRRAQERVDLLRFLARTVLVLSFNPPSPFPAPLAGGRVPVRPPTFEEQTALPMGVTWESLVSTFANLGPQGKAAEAGPVRLAPSRPDAHGFTARQLNQIWLDVGLESSWTDSEVLATGIEIATLPLPIGKVGRVGTFTALPTMAHTVRAVRLAGGIASAKTAAPLLKVWAIKSPGGAVLRRLLPHFDDTLRAGWAISPFQAKIAALAYLKAERIITVALVKAFVPTVGGQILTNLVQGTPFEEAVRPFTDPYAAWGRDEFERTIDEIPDVAFELLWSEFADESPVPLPGHDKAKEFWLAFWKKVREKLGR